MCQVLLYNIISEFDTFNLGSNNYSLSLYIDGKGIKCNDGIHRLYFNTAVDDGTELSNLLQYMADSNAERTDFGALSQAVKHHKIANEGVDSMCEAVEIYAREFYHDLLVESENNAMLKGIIEGKREGIIEGKREGIIEGKREGIIEGKREGIIEGKREGIIEGKREGIIEGKREGIIEGKIEVIKNMLREEISLETALKITGVDEEVFRRYADSEQLQ